MSGSFQCPGAAYGASASCANPILLIDSQVSRISPVVREVFPPTSGPHFHTSARPYWHRLYKIGLPTLRDRKSTRLNSSHGYISYAVFCLKKKIMRASIKMIGVSNLQSFIASMTQKLTLSDISDESKNYLDKAGITTACLRIKSKWTAGGK